MTAAIEKINTFINNYHTELSKMTAEIVATENRLHDISLETSYIKGKQIPDSIEVRITNGDNKPENKARKLLNDLQNEQLLKDEEIIVLRKMLHNFKLASAAKIESMEKAILRDAKTMDTSEAFHKMLKAKEAYLNTLASESQTIRKYNEIQGQLDTIKRDAGINVSHTPIEIPYTIQLDVSKADVIKLVKG